MGFRSTFLVGDQWLTIQPWFQEKYKEWVNFAEGKIEPLLPISSKFENKFYALASETELFLDIQKLLLEGEGSSQIWLVLLHECGGISQVEITRDYIVMREPIGWEKVESVGHSYCYGCVEDLTLTPEEANDIKMLRYEKAEQERAKIPFDKNDICQRVAYIDIDPLEFLKDDSIQADVAKGMVDAGIEDKFKHLESLLQKEALVHNLELVGSMERHRIRRPPFKEIRLQVVASYKRKDSL